MPYFGKLIDVGETAMPHFNFAQKGYPAPATEDICCEKLIDNSSRQGITSIGSQNSDQLSLTRTSSKDNCEKIQANFVTLPADNDYSKAKKGCENTVAKENADGFLEFINEEKLTTPVPLGEIFLPRSGKKTQFMKQTKKKTWTQTLPPLLEEAMILYRKVELFLELCVNI